MDTQIDPIYLVPEIVLTGDLKTEQFFKALNEKQQKYATYLTLANFALFPLLTASLSVESPDIHAFLSKFISSLAPDTVNLAFSSPNESNRPLRQLIEYAAVFYKCSSNYRGFGDTKFIPRLSKSELISLVGNNPARPLLDTCIEAMYSLSPPSIRSQGFAPNITRYYTPDFTRDEVKAIDQFLAEHNVRVENTTISRDDANSRYYVHVYSIQQSEEILGKLNDKTIILKKGKNSEDLKKSVKWLELARDCADSETQRKMLTALISHYQTGKVEDHVEYSAIWVQDTEPAVESHMGFIETYRDPAGVRAEFEGLVACVDKKESVILHKFVDASSIVLPLLPYPREYERAAFSPPSYNALQVLSACINDYPIGINIPNYDEIRMKIGFKNVTLMNIMATRAMTESHFVPPEHKAVFLANAPHAQVTHVACHELYGHGSGRLLGKADIEKGVPDLLTEGRKVASYYPEGMSYDNAFGPIGSSLEECRAETTAMFLILHHEVLDIFQVPKPQQPGFMLAEVYYLLRRAFTGLLDYDPAQGVWRQAHSRGRFAILKALLMWSRGAVAVRKNFESKPSDQKRGKDEENDQYSLVIDEKRLQDVSDGLAMMLKHLNYYKATCQVEPAEAFYSSLSSVDPFWLGVRTEVEGLEKKELVMAQATVVKKGNEWTLMGKENPNAYDATMTIIQNVQTAISA